MSILSSICSIALARDLDRSSPTLTGVHTLPTSDGVLIEATDGKVLAQQGILACDTDEAMPTTECILAIDDLPALVKIAKSKHTITWQDACLHIIHPQGTTIVRYIQGTYPRTEAMWVRPIIGHGFVPETAISPAYLALVQKIMCQLGAEKTVCPMPQHDGRSNRFVGTHDNRYIIMPITIPAVEEARMKSKVS